MAEGNTIQDGNTAIQEAPQAPAAPAAAQNAQKPEAVAVAEKSEYSSSERFIAAVGYVSFLCLLPLILRRDSEFCQFNGKQGLFMCIFFFAFSFLNFIPVIKILFTIFEICVIAIFVILTWKGTTIRIPIVADWADKLALTKEEEEEQLLKEQVAEEAKAMNVKQQ